MECISLSSGEGRFTSRPGRITHDSVASSSGGIKTCKITYTPDENTLPGTYRVVVPFKVKQKNGLKADLCTKTAEFKVVDTTPIGMITDNGKSSYLIDMSRERDDRGPVKIYVQGPRNQQVKLDLCYARDENNNPVTIRDPKTVGAFKTTSLKLTGGGKMDELVYCRGPSTRCGEVIATARFGNFGQALKFIFVYKDIESAVLIGNVPIAQEQTILVRLKHSLATGLGSYKTAHPVTFTFLGQRNSSLSIRMVWVGCSHGHLHNDPSADKRATGFFTGFTQKGDHWVPGAILVNNDGTVNYRNISYETSGVAGTIAVIVSLKNRDGNQIGNRAFKFYLDVAYPGLKKLEVSESDNIKLVGQTDIHPDNHYGTQALIDAIKAVAKAYGEACDNGEFNDNGVAPSGDNKKLWVNDMSMRYGGRLDCKHEGIGKKALKPFQSPHEEHMFGEEVDISKSYMNTKQRTWFDRNAALKETVIFDDGTKRTSSVFGFERCDDEGDHFHCSLVKA